MNTFETRRRDLIAAPLLTMAAMALRLKPAQAAGVDPTMTIIKRPDEIPWKGLYNFPSGMAESATMYGAIDAPGQYFVLIRWHPGYMSAPHWYETDRLYVVMSGTWYVASGEDFAPDATVPVPAGSFVRRVAKTPHYDGVKKGAAGAGDHRDLGHWADPLPPDRPNEAGLAGSLIVRPIRILARLMGADPSRSPRCARRWWEIFPKKQTASRKSLASLLPPRLVSARQKTA